MGRCLENETTGDSIYYNIDFTEISLRGNDYTQVSQTESIIVSLEKTPYAVKKAYQFGNTRTSNLSHKYQPFIIC